MVKCKESFLENFSNKEQQQLPKWITDVQKMMNIMVLKLFVKNLDVVLLHLFGFMDNLIVAVHRHHSRAAEPRQGKKKSAETEDWCTKNLLCVSMLADSIVEYIERVEGNTMWRKHQREMWLVVGFFLHFFGRFWPVGSSTLNTFNILFFLFFWCWE